MFLLQAVVIASIALATATAQGAQVCGKNEGSNLCGRMCEPTCENPHPNPRFCPRLQCTRFTESCRCHDGYLRSSSGGCSLPQNCPKRQ